MGNSATVPVQQDPWEDSRIQAPPASANSSAAASADPWEDKRIGSTSTSQPSTPPQPLGPVGRFLERATGLDIADIKAHPRSYLEPWTDEAEQKRIELGQKEEAAQKHPTVPIPGNQTYQDIKNKNYAGAAGDVLPTALAVVQMAGGGPGEEIAPPPVEDQALATLPRTGAKPASQTGEALATRPTSQNVKPTPPPPKPGSARVISEPGEVQQMLQTRKPVSTDTIGPRTAKPRTSTGPFQPEDQGFDFSNPDKSAEIRQQTEKTQGAMPRGERRAVPRTADEQATQKYFAQARQELETANPGKNVSSDEVMDRVSQLKQQANAPKTVQEKADHYKNLAGNAKDFEKTFGQPIDQFVKDDGSFDMKEFMQSLVKPNVRAAADNAGSRAQVGPGTAAGEVSRQYGADGIRVLQDVSGQPVHEWDQIWQGGSRASRTSKVARPGGAEPTNAAPPKKPPQSVTVNGSGESAASAEAIKAKQSNANQGVKQYLFDTRGGGKVTPGNEVSFQLRPEDFSLGKTQALVKLHSDGTVEEVNKGSEARPYTFQLTQ